MNSIDLMINWLKRILSLQTISVVIAILGVYFAYKTYMQNKESSIAIEMFDPVNEKFINIDEASIILTMYPAEDEDEEYVKFVYDDEKCTVLLPTFRNKSNKSLKNFKCEVEIGSFDDKFDLEENEKYINPHYEIQSREHDYDLDYDVELRYKDNILHAQSELPSPLKRWHYYICEDLFLVYKISYDGLSKPMMIYQIIAIDNGEFEWKDEDVVNYLEQYIYHKCIPSRYKTKKDHYAIIVSDGLCKFRIKKGVIRMQPEYKTDLDKLIEEVVERNRRNALDSIK